MSSSLAVWFDQLSDVIGFRWNIVSPLLLPLYLIQQMHGIQISEAQILFGHQLLDSSHLVDLEKIKTFCMRRRQCRSKGKSTSSDDRFTQLCTLQNLESLDQTNQEMNKKAETVQRKQTQETKAVVIQSFEKNN